MDPLQSARVMVQVPAVLSTGGAWAMPCSPYAGPGVGFVMVPPVGASVWVEFEQGDPSYPIWSGCFWGSGQLPTEAAVTPPDQVQVIKSDAFLLVADAVSSSFRIEISAPIAAGTKITVDNSGVVIDNGQGATVTIKGPTVDVNSGALTVT